MHLNVIDPEKWWLFYGTVILASVAVSYYFGRRL